MKKISGKLRVALLSAIILSVVCVALLTVSIFISYKTTINYFDKSLVYSITKALIAVSVIGAVAVVFILPKNELSGDSPTTLPVSISAFLPTVAFGIMSIVLLLSGILHADYYQSGNLVVYLCSALSMLSAVYFMLNCVSADAKNSVKLFFGYAVPLASVLTIATTYFDMRVSMNAPAKIFIYLALISFSFWMLLEARITAERPCPRLYFILGLITTVLSASASVPWIIALIAGKLGAPIYPSYIIYNIVILTIFAYVLTRMIVFVNARALIEKLSEQTYSDDTPDNADKN